MNSPHSWEDVCQKASVLSQSIALKIVLGVKCVLCLGGMVAAVVLLWKKGLSWLGSPLTRTVFLGHVSSALLCSLLFAVCYAYDIFRLSQVHVNPCDYTLDMTFAFIMRIIPVFGMFGSIYFMVCLALERSFATIAHSSYEVASKSKIVAHLVVIVVVILSLAVPVSFLVPPIDWSNRMYIFNTRTDENSFMFQIMIWLEIVPEMAAIVVFHLVLYTNTRRSPHSNDEYLERRVQIESNKRVISILLPVLWTHLFFTASTTFGITLIPLFAPNLSVTSWYISMECVNVIQMYPCALALVLSFKLVFRPVQLPSNQISSILERNKEAKQAEEHFDQLQGYFDEGEDFGRPPWYSGLCC